MSHVVIRPFLSTDIDNIVKQFANNNWTKPRVTFENYWQEQTANERILWLAFHQQQFAGYITLKWDSLYPPFQDKKIPEIMDLNVLPPYRNQGVGSALLDVAEAEASKQHAIVGLGVGLYPDYGSAQKLYIKRGYRPDGLGITWNYQRVIPGSQVCLDDDLILWFTKELTRT